MDDFFFFCASHLARIQQTKEEFHEVYPILPSVSFYQSSHL